MSYLVHVYTVFVYGIYGILHTVCDFLYTVFIRYFDFFLSGTPGMVKRL